MSKSKKTSNKLSKKTSKFSKSKKTSKSIEINLGGYDFVEPDLPMLEVFTDGSCSANGKPGSVGGIGIHFPNKELNDISKIYRNDYCTNQRTELCAILTAIKYIKDRLSLEKYQLIIKTDSKYSIDCVTKWVNSWIKNGWLTKNGSPVSNKEYIEKIHELYLKYNIKFIHVEAHTSRDDLDSIGNKKADKLATDATKKALLEKKKTIMKTGGSKHGKSRISKSTSQSSYNQFSDLKKGDIMIELVK
jgi:ribonuclease HI